MLFRSGTEVITVVPASDASIFNGAAEAASETQNNNIATFNEKVVPTISGVSINSANSTLTVTFSENVYDTDGGSGDLEAADFAVSRGAGGTATVAATPTGISPNSASEWVLTLGITGIADGSCLR